MPMIEDWGLGSDSFQKNAFDIAEKMYKEAIVNKNVCYSAYEHLAESLAFTMESRLSLKKGDVFCGGKFESRQGAYFCYRKKISGGRFSRTLYTVFFKDVPYDWE
jgi:hypothetical protein